MRLLSRIARRWFGVHQPSSDVRAQADSAFQRLAAIHPHLLPADQTLDGFLVWWIAAGGAPDDAYILDHYMDVCEAAGWMDDVNDVEPAASFGQTPAQRLQTPVDAGVSSPSSDVGPKDAAKTVAKFGEPAPQSLAEPAKVGAKDVAGADKVWPDDATFVAPTPALDPRISACAFLGWIAREGLCGPYTSSDMRRLYRRYCASANVEPCKENPFRRVLISMPGVSKAVVAVDEKGRDRVTKWVLNPPETTYTTQNKVAA